MKDSYKRANSTFTSSLSLGYLGVVTQISFHKIAVPTEYPQLNCFSTKFLGFKLSLLSCRLVEMEANVHVWCSNT